MKIALIICAVILTVIGAAMITGLCGSGAITFTIQLDGKPLSPSNQPEVLIDGKPYLSGLVFSPGSHNLTAKLANVNPVNKRVWIIWGSKNIGVLPLESKKGELLVEVNPSTAYVILRQGTEKVAAGNSPVTFKIPVGNYVVEAARGEYREYKSIEIFENIKTNLTVFLNLGGVELSASPKDAEFVLANNNHRWQGNLPTNIVDLPAGNYSLTVRRAGWELDSDIIVSRSVTLTNQIVFPYGSIEVSSEPAGLMISTNGIEIGKTPTTLRELRPGQYSLTASDGENDLIANLSLAPKEAAKHDFIFHYGAVQLVSVPAGATVIRKGKDLGKTPLTLNHIPAGELIVELRLHDYVSTNITIKTVGDVTNQFSAQLVSELYIQAIGQAREAYISGQFEKAQKFLAAALVIQPDDIVATTLRDDVVKAAAKAEAAQKELDRKSEIARKESEQSEIKGIIEKAIDATGGREVLNQFRSFKMVSRTVGKKDGNDFMIRSTFYVQFPDNIRLDQEAANPPKKLGLLTVTVNDGKPNNSIFCVTRNISWEVIPTILGPIQQDAPQNIQKLFRGILYNMECASLLPLVGSDYTLEKSFTTEDSAVAIKVHKSGKDDLTLLFYKNSGLLLGIDSIGSDERGRTFQQSERFSEYRRFSGIMRPTNEKYVREGNTFSDSVLESFEPFNEYYGNVFNRPNNQ